MEEPNGKYPADCTHYLVHPIPTKNINSNSMSDWVWLKAGSYFSLYIVLVNFYPSPSTQKNRSSEAMEGHCHVQLKGSQQLSISGDTYHRAWSRSLQWNGSRLSVHNPERSMSGTPQKKLKYIWKKVQVFYTKNNEYRFDLELQVLVQSAVPVSKGFNWFWLIFNDTLLVHSEWEIRS